MSERSREPAGVPPRPGLGDLARFLPRNVWVLSLTSFLRDVASEMLVYLVPLFMANVLGSRTVVGS